MVKSNKISPFKQFLIIGLLISSYFFAIAVIDNFKLQADHITEAEKINFSNPSGIKSSYMSIDSPAANGHNFTVENYGDAIFFKDVSNIALI